jgi:hypothetical protein
LDFGLDWSADCCPNIFVTVPLQDDGFSLILLLCQLFIILLLVCLSLSRFTTKDFAAPAVHCLAARLLVAVPLHDDMFSFILLLCRLFIVLLLACFLINIDIKIQ